MTQTIPKTTQEFEEFLADKAKVAQLQTDGQFGEFIAAYARNQMATPTDDAPTLADDIRQQAQAAKADMLRERGAVVRPDARSRTTTDPSAIGSVLNGQFANVGEFMRSAMPVNKQSARHAEQWRQIQNDYSSVDPSSGGFLVPERFREQLLMRAVDVGMVRANAMVVPMDGPIVSFPAVDETTHSGSIYGGISWTWVGEGEALPESQARFARVKLAVAKLVTRCDVPSELPMDSPRAFGGFIDQAMPDAIAFGEDYAGLNGTGVGQPLGVLASANAGKVVVTKETNQPASTIVVENIDKMYSRMLPSELGSAMWVAAIDTLPQLVSMARPVGTGGSPVWLNNGIVGAPPVTIYGRPVRFTEMSPALTNQGDLSFISWRQYMFGDLGQMRVQSSSEYQFGNDIISYRVIERADGRPATLSPLTPANGSTNTLSPYVMLGAR